jgi:hypothetical protein
VLRNDWDGLWPPLVAAGAALMALWLGGGCSSDVLDVQVDLQREVFDADFGPPAGNIPDVACDPAAPGACGVGVVGTGTAAAAALPADVSVSVGCDAASARCFGQALAHVPYAVDVLQDDSFTSSVGRRAIGLVRVADLAYTVPINTLTFDLPKIDVYVGPPGTARETDSGVAFVDSTTPIPAAATFTAERHLTLADGSAARALVESSIKAQQPFVVLLVLAPRVEAGKPVPAGGLEVALQPRLTIGFR